MSLPGANNDLLSTLDNGLLTLTLNRPERLNALNQSLFLRLTDALRDATDDPDVRAVLLRGAGRAFCTGGDIKGAQIADPSYPVNMKQSREEGWPTKEMYIDRLNRHSESVMRLHTMGKPTIAMVQGYAAGAGMALALACDLRICGKGARFMTAFAQMGFSGDCGISFFLPRLVGPAKARELMFLSEAVDAAGAERLGLANWVVDDAELDQKANEIATRLARGPTVAYRYMKRNLGAAETSPLGEILQLEATNQRMSAMTADHTEARAAFIAKRSPQFSGS